MFMTATTIGLIMALNTSRNMHRGEREQAGDTPRPRKVLSIYSYNAGMHLPYPELYIAAETEPFPWRLLALQPHWDAVGRTRQCSMGSSPD